MSRQKPRQRGGRVPDKATPEQVMGLGAQPAVDARRAREGPGGRHARPSASWPTCSRRRTRAGPDPNGGGCPDRPGSPGARPWRDTTGGMASFPADRGREQLESPEFVDRAEDLVLHGDVGCGKTHLAIAIGMLACQRMIPVRFFTASSLVMRLRKAKDDNRLDAELKSMGRAGPVIIDEPGHLPIDIDGARLLFQAGADCYETRSVISASNLESGGWGDVSGDGDMAAAVIDRIVHHGGILRFHGESYRNRHSLMR